MVISCKKKLEIAKTYSFSELNCGETFYVSTIDIHKDIYMKVDCVCAIRLIDGEILDITGERSVVPVDVEMEWRVRGE